MIRVLTLQKSRNSQLATRTFFTNFAFMNNLGNFLTLSTFGESHGIAYGGIITNFPAGIEINFEEIQHQLDRRKPGQSSIVTQRKESDTVQFLSELLRGMSRNSDWFCDL